MPDKRIIVINEKGGCGKDYLINKLSKVCCSNIMNVSSITPVVEIMKYINNKIHDYGQKSLDLNTDKDRYRLYYSQMKQVTDEMFGLSLRYLYSVIFGTRKNHTNSFICNKSELCFIHIRESYNIRLFCALLKPMFDSDVKYKDKIDIKTLLITNPEVDGKVYNNDSDNNVFNYEYDYVFDNSEQNISLKRLNEFAKLIMEGM